MLSNEKIAEVVRAKKQIADGSLVIWQTRLETLAASHGPATVLRFLSTPVEPRTDTNINCPCQNTVPGCGAPRPTDGVDDILKDLPPPPKDDGPDLPSVDD